ncbi:MAG TPA: O-methyltransferase [Acidimicrobiales bacterium]|nr:O-methyltransferase [Acidimicrobiales bacterium]
MPKSFLLNEDLHRYIVEHTTPFDELRARLVEETSALGGVSQMQVAPEQSVFLTLVTRLVGARRAIEVGTFTGLSALSIAAGLAPGGTLICCDVSDEWTTIARRYWKEAGVDDRIELRLGPALGTLANLPAGPSLDLAFIDADKGGYIGYWEAIVPRTRQGGVILADNTLAGGSVVDESVTYDMTVAIREFNDHAAADRRVDLVLLPISDGLTMAVKR